MQILQIFFKAEKKHRSDHFAIETVTGSIKGCITSKRVTGPNDRDPKLMGTLI